MVPSDHPSRLFVAKDMACKQIQVQVAHDEKEMGKCQRGGLILPQDSQVSASLMRHIPPIVVDMRIRLYDIERKLKVP
jgi:hypothetical protein